MAFFVVKTLSQAIVEINKLGLQYESEGEGGIVKKQYPQAGTMMFKNGIVVLTT